ncbi:MAG: hypothetical protein Q9201_002224 [Fulgogasparrea decipioides]
MDVTNRTFHHLFPSLVAAIADANFVAIDLELSGIPGQQINRPRAPGTRTGGKPSLQERYDEIKTAAEKYQVLQLGITCVGENRNRGVYVVRPYNFFLDPVPDERLHIERIISYQSGAVDFLLKNNFRMEGPFVEGVPYLSRREEATARHLAAQRQDKTGMTDIKVRDAEAGQFMQRVQEEVYAWKNRLLPMPDFLNIAPVGHERPDYRGAGLNNYQKALVHHYIRAEHPDLATISRSGFIQIVAYNKEREDAEQEFRNRKFEERLAKQIGLRWLVEAIHGGDLSGIDAYSFNPAVPQDKNTIAIKFNGLRKQLRGQSTVLVGHNIFLDLIYFYACFFGPLPDRVEDFQRCIHQTFPRIIDTKYLATHSLDNPALARSSLDELDEELSKQAQPLIELHPDHSKYKLAKPSHEAGFDSYLTARILVRLSTMLESSGIYVDDEDDYYTPPENQSSSGDSDGVSLDAYRVSAQLRSNDTDPRKSRRQSGSASGSKRSPLSHDTVFDLLGDIPSDEDPIKLARRAKNKKPSASFEPAVQSNTKGPDVGGRMPAWDSDFWNVYGNKLRVNGTIEQVCHVGSWPH